MTTIHFQDFQCHDDRPQYTQLEGIQRILAFVGNHSTEFELLVSEPGTGALSNFDTADAQGTWQITGGYIQGVGGGAAQWYKIRHITPVEPGFVATFDWDSGGCAYLFGADDDFSGYMVWWDGTDVGIASCTETEHTDFTKRPFAVSGPSSVTVGVWPRSYYSIDEIDDLIVAVWFDDQLALAYAIPYVSTMSNHTGFGVYQSGTVKVDDYQIVELHQIQEWTTVGPGEVAGAGLSRVIGQEDILLRARYDGTIRVWVEDSSVSDWTVPAARPVQYSKTTSLYWPNHLRMVGALYEDSALFRPGNQGHIFETVQDPNALTAAATSTRGQRQHARIEESSQGIAITMPPNLALEVEDIITYDGTAYRIKAITLNIQMAGTPGGKEVPVLMGTYQCEQCLSRTGETGAAA